LLAVGLTARGFGPFAHVSHDPNTRVLALQLFLAVTAVSTLLVGSLSAQRARMEGERRQSQTLAALGEFAARVAHDFNNDLTVIRGWAEDLDEGDSSDRVRDASAEITKAAHRAGSVVQQLLTFGSKEVSTSVVVAPAELLQSLEPMLRRTLTSQHRLNLEVADEAWPVRADPHQLQVALINLAANAREAMPDGGALTVGVRNESEPPEADRVVLFVGDEGAGIAPADLARIFEPFFTTRGGLGGTGLGLTTVRRVAERAGGEVRVRSESGAGTTFEIVRPRA
jgi:signal transduction histidine kinase